jgi:hypothetical protein
MLLIQPYYKYFIEFLCYRYNFAAGDLESKDQKKLLSYILIGGDIP